MSLRTRIALLVGITVLVATAIGGIGTSISSRNVGRDRVDQALLDDIENFNDLRPRLAEQLQFAFDARRATCDDNTDGGDPSTSPPPNRREARLRFLPEFTSNLQLVQANGAVSTACQALPVDDEDRMIAETGTGNRFRTVTVDGQRFRVLTRGYGDIGAVQFGRSLEISEATLRGLVVRSLTFGLIGAGLASLLGWLFAKRATEPVMRLSEAAERVAQTQDLGERISVEGDDEIGALAESFNTMLSSLDTSREQQQRLVQDASHELRTPLTSMRTNVELLQRHRDIDPDVRATVLADIESELHELTQLTSELVDSATEVPSTFTLRDEVDLAGIVEDCADRARRRHRRPITVSRASSPATDRPAADEVASDSIVVGDVGLLSRAVTNLINNAAKFSDAETDILVTITGGEVLVRDQGPGVAADDLPHIFDRFYRATAARSAPGSGLGLAIVKQIVVGHGGSVRAANRPEGGAEIGFELPLVSAHLG